MSQEIEYNPFIIKGYFDKLHFCDRDHETNKLFSNLVNQTNTTIFSPRKLGKTGLIYHIFETCKSELNCKVLYIDLYATQNITDFTSLLAKEVFLNIPKTKSLTKKFLDSIKALRPTLSFDPLTGNPEMSLNMVSDQIPNENIENLFQYLDSLGIPVYIAFDEFQQIVHYPETNTEALLRTILQKLKNCVFIFAGSHATIMNEMFNSAKRPFYSSTSSLSLGKIPTDAYRTFIQQLFKSRGRTISLDAIDFILTWTTGYTYPVQYVCHEIFATGKRNIDITFSKLVAAQILQEQAHIFLQYRNLITAPQWQLLKALAKEESTKQPFNKDFLIKYRLGAASSTKRSLDSLIEKELILAESTPNGMEYSVYDKLFLRYLQRLP
ncbi:MAG: ATP-binding protein [Bacteroidota bacterium]|nr:ATP-binding protein [Bacteroidota bacterium]